MPRPLRNDVAGSRYHLVNRSHHGLAPFEEKRAQRAFLARIACAVRANRIRVHAFCLMRNHYHILVESLDGDISATLQMIQGPFAGWFNHVFDHKGHVFGGRFKCFRISDNRYLFAVVRYIDRNPMEVRPGLDPLQYGPGSARLHVQENLRPLWLEGSLIDACLQGELRQGHDRPEAYRRTFGLGQEGLRSSSLIEARLQHAVEHGDDLSSLWSASPAEWISWIRTRGPVGGGATPPVPVADTRSVIESVEVRRLAAPGAALPSERGPAVSVWPVLQCGLLRDLGGMRWAGLAATVGVNESTVRERYARHRRAVLLDAPYAALAASAARLAIETCFADVPVPRILGG